MHTLATFSERVQYIKADVSTLQGCKQVADMIKKGPIKADILVNSAGIYCEKRLGGNSGRGLLRHNGY